MIANNLLSLHIVILFHISKTSTLLNKHGKKNKCNGLNLKYNTNPALNNFKLKCNKMERHEHIQCKDKGI